MGEPRDGPPPAATRVTNDVPRENNGLLRWIPGGSACKMDPSRFFHPDSDATPTLVYIAPDYWSSFVYDISPEPSFHNAYIR